MKYGPFYLIVLFVPVILFGMMDILPWVGILAYALTSFLGACLMVLAWQRLKERGRVLGLPIAKAGAPGSGFVKLEGTAMPYKPHKAPISGRDCCYYHSAVQQQEGKHWNTLYTGGLSGTAKPPFLYIEDATGRVLVQLQSADLEDYKKEYPSRSPEFSAVWRKLGKDKEGFLDRYIFGNAIAVEETVIPAGVAVLVLGEARLSKELGEKIVIRAQRVSPRDEAAVAWRDLRRAAAFGALAALCAGVSAAAAWRATSSAAETAASLALMPVVALGLARIYGEKPSLLPED